MPKSLSFDEALDILANRRNPWRRRLAIMIDVLLACCAIGLVVAVSWFPAIWLVHAYHEDQEVNAAVNRIAQWPQGRIVGEYHRAQAYNRKVADSGQATLGEFTDPFADEGPGGSGSSGSSSSHGGKAKSRPVPESERDTEYQSLLNDGTGIMGTIRIPKVSVNMPIYHGTSDEVLLKGAGHLYGTSLPVGGKSTNAVLSGHRGLSNALLFTRIDELRKGDVFYIQTLNRTMGYRVVGIHVIDPSDTYLYKVVPGKDLVTLMTCTPYGINTQRLIITGVRQPIPDPIPDPNDAKGDPIILGVLVTLGALLLGLLAGLLRRLLRGPRRPLPTRHASLPFPPTRFRARGGARGGGHGSGSADNRRGRARGSAYVGAHSRRGVIGHGDAGGGVRERRGAIGRGRGSRRVAAHGRGKAAGHS
ncbi:class C sortase [Bifidobacterium sp. ESL0763]|uniref:class C sortase n=1 Tax=Bifidobacterium sp. ESL0763 TaxID=2983227 RepID=UPI0023F929FE|nr:class C sortase [Bifidobacterium sp. ESL0763]MDF7664450.1 class C sortase [Bifidobacterium sp. ESL0763]